MTLSLKHQRILIIAPHPDDEVFGCGGLISRCKREGGKIFVLFMTVGTTKDFSKKGISTQVERLNEIRRVVKLFKIDGYRVAFPGDDYHLRLDTVAQKDLVHEIERGKNISLEVLRPTMVIGSAPDDYNQDHRAVANAMMTATRPAAADMKALQPIVLYSELPSSSWTPHAQRTTKNFFVELTQDDLKRKIAAIRLYKSQLKGPRSPISVKGATALAQLRGMQSGTDWAEAYVAKRLLI